MPWAERPAARIDPAATRPRGALRALLRGKGCRTERYSVVVTLAVACESTYLPQQDRPRPVTYWFGDKS
jgi:hypothetical protein